MKVAEIFGPTIQGEGVSTGRCAFFIRLSGCNLTCSWCDTPYTWDDSRFDLSKESTDMTVTEIVEWVDDSRCKLVVLTGGEPFMQKETPTLVAELLGAGIQVEIETNGTLIPRNLPAEARLNVSPKLASSGVRLSKRIKKDRLVELQEFNSTFKFVIADSADLDEVVALVNELMIPRSRVYLMPEGTDSEKIMLASRWLAPLAAQQGFNFSTRLHTLIWEDERGH